MIRTEIPSLFHCVANASSSLSFCLSSHSPLVINLYLCFAFSIYSFLWSIVGQNCSKVDQLWSLTPAIYSWVFLLHSYLSYPSSSSSSPPPPLRLLLVCILISLWSIRLTYNFYRRGGYGNLITHEEDHRWPVLRRLINSPLLFLLFNLTFISFYQNLLLLLITLPLHGIYTSYSYLSYRDLLLTLFFLFFLLIETVADEQHFAFHRLKASFKDTAARKQSSNSDIRDGFLQSGLFSLCRHPNYFAEQCMWIVVFLFSLLPNNGESYQEVIARNGWLGSGALQLVLLFQGSMAFGESITASKYPRYAHYQATTSQCIPSFASFFRGSSEKGPSARDGGSKRKENTARKKAT